MDPELIDRQTEPQTPLPPAKPSMAPVEDGARRIEKKLDEVLQELKQISRLRQHRDFSLIRLVAVIAQLFVVAFVFWTIIGAIDLGEPNPPTATTLKLLGAAVLQLLALTCFVVDHQSR